ncbi:MAG: hypothetical protein ACYTG5_08380 [Planctomycetota bacterium]|jgi:hypothetical protein
MPAKLLISTLFLSVLSGCASGHDDFFAPSVSVEAGAEPPGNYIRYQSPEDQQPGALFSGSTRWYQEDSETTLFVVGVLHIGELEYYQELQTGLDSCDLVLFEGVRSAEDDKEPSEEQLASMDLLMRLQLAMKDALDLTFQKDGIDYERDFWRNADMDFASMQARMQELGTGLPTDNPLLRNLLDGVLRLLDPSQVRKHPTIVQRLRRTMGPTLQMANEVMQGPSFAKMGQVIIIERNAVVMDMLAEAIAEGPNGRRIALFYGAGHLPDFDRRLEELGWTYQGEGWHRAWNIEPEKARKGRK